MGHEDRGRRVSKGRILEENGGKRKKGGRVSNGRILEQHGARIKGQDG
jgi:hypothetical protein